MPDQSLSRNAQKRLAKARYRHLVKHHPEALAVQKALFIADGPEQRYVFPMTPVGEPDRDGNLVVRLSQFGKPPRFFKVSFEPVDEPCT
jgi:hypothetical protein